MILVALSKQNNLLEVFDDINISHNLTILNRNSTLFKNMDEDSFNYAGSGAPAYYHHYWGISPEKFV